MTATETPPVVLDRNAERAVLPEFSIADDTVSSLPEIEKTSRLKSRRSKIVILLFGLLGLALFSQIVGVVRHDQRQRHLAYEFGLAAEQVPLGGADLLLQIPRIGVNEIVANGASSTELRGGPGRVVGTADLDDGGNVVVLGRSTRSGAPFAALDQMVVGDAVVVRSRSGMTRAYTVALVETLDDSEAVPLRGRGDQITLVTSAATPLPRARTMVVASADQPLATVTEGLAAPDAAESEELIRYVPLRIDALDERSQSAVGAFAAVMIVLLAAWAFVRATASLRRSYSATVVRMVSVPLIGLVALLLVVLCDGMFPSTF